MTGNQPPKFLRLLNILLRIFFHRLYHSFAWTYDFVAKVVSLGMWKEWIRAIISDLPGPRVLEIGHGTGWLQKALLEADVEVYGLDESKQMGRQAQNKARRFDQSFALVRGICQALPFPSEYFNQVAATFPSEYILDPKSVGEIFRVLVPGGCLEILPVAWIVGKGFFERLAAGLFRLTGQAGDWDPAYLAPFIQAGFNCRVTRKMVKSSQVLIVLAEKPG